MFPADAKNMALKISIPSFKATTRATSEENGKSVAAKKAEKKSANSAI